MLTHMMDLIWETTDYYGNNLHMNLVHHGQSDSLRHILRKHVYNYGADWPHSQALYIFSFDCLTVCKNGARTLQEYHDCFNQVWLPQFMHMVVGW